MNGMDYWRLCNELTVVQAALLIVGVDPATCQDSVCEWDAEKRPQGFDAAMAALTHAILSCRLPATIRRSAWERGWNEDPEEDESIGKDYRGVQIIYKPEPSWHLTTVTVEALQSWLRGRGIRTGFFFAEKSDTADYLNANNSFYSPKLAAAIRAWEAVSQNPDAVHGKTVKQAIMKWLRINAERFSLTKEDGKPNEQGIEEVSKIANWDTKGGAPKTPGQ